MKSTEKRDFDAASKTWDDNPGRTALAMHVAEAILKAIPVSENMDAIDYGCGTGLITLALQPHVRSITGLDSSAGMLEALRSKAAEREIANVRTMLVDLESDSIPDMHADLIVSSMTMHHISDVSGVFHKFYEMLNPG
ncbi:MAG TPA: class I SAM-dependent methyltransferase, partial [Armatimonadota bacterium]